VPLADGTDPSNLLVGSSAYVLSLLDSSGTSVVVFDQPLSMTFTPSTDDLAGTGGDASAIVVSVYNADSGTYDVLPTVLNEDGTLTAVCSAIGTVPPSAPAAPDAEPVE
jgi:hypothetical protein